MKLFYAAGMRLDSVVTVPSEKIMIVRSRDKNWRRDEQGDECRDQMVEADGLQHDVQSKIVSSEMQPT